MTFWNLVGAGIFGFLINPPIVLYYIQGINTTPLHAHTALFGVYGLLAISLMLFSMRHTVAKAAWSDRLLEWSFWGLNGGLALMTVVSSLRVLPVLLRGQGRPVVRAQPRDHLGRGLPRPGVDSDRAGPHLRRGRAAALRVRGRAIWLSRGRTA